ncbi:MAG: RNA pseudouridine synthase [Candidatus Amulumruptor caecigallinarius]|nr:MAG: RNA pseudouridine synthase [Candidatus Amulumruptor caecigallinarius]
MAKLNHKPGAQRNAFKPDVIETFNVAEDAVLLPFLMSAMPSRPRTAVKALLKHGQVKVGDTPTTQWNMLLKSGDRVHVNFTRAFHVFRNPRLRLVYEDDDILVVNKGYGLLSVSTDNVKEGTAYSILRDYVKWSNPANKIFIVHRLDRDTSGLMVFAKNIKAKEALQHNWNNMVLERKYLAVVEGIPDCESDTIRSYLTENARHEVYSTDVKGEGQLAVTRYATLMKGKGRAMLEVDLDTGRKNQIRVHMKEMGHPIVGDRRYGAGVSPIHRLALHARTLRFVHPVTRQEMAFTTPIPAAFLSLVR